MVTWILEKDVFSERCFDEMVEHFKSNDIPHHIVRVIPFVHEIEGKVPNVAGPCVVYGSIGAQKIAIDNGWNPGVWTNDNFNENIVKEKLGELYLNYDSVVCKMSQVTAAIGPTSSTVDQINQQEISSTFFIKPNSDTKEFAGQTIEAKDFKSWYENLISIGYLDNNDFDVVISSVKDVSKEWRLVILNKKVIAYSVYKQYREVLPERSAPNKLIAFAEKIANKFSPADVFVIDVALNKNEFEPNGEYKVIEYNTFNSAGLYHCDVGAIIDGINEWIS